MDRYTGIRGGIELNPVEDEVFVEVSNLQGSDNPFEVSRPASGTTYKRTKTTIHWVRETHAAIVFRHGGKVLDTGSVYNDYWGNCTSAEAAMKEVRSLIKEYKVDGDSTLEIQVVGRLLETPTLGRFKESVNEYAIEYHPVNPKVNALFLPNADVETYNTSDYPKMQDGFLNGSQRLESFEYGEFVIFSTMSSAEDNEKALEEFKRMVRDVERRPTLDILREIHEL